LIISSSAAMADPAAAAPPAATDAASTADLDRIECRTTAPETGTRLGAKRQCRTVRDWNELRDRAQKTLNDVQSRSLQQTSPGS
jgi:hypothetical protein